VHARALLSERRITHLPVMSNERLVGIVSTHDLDARSVSGSGFRPSHGINS
jgi:CBS domain-containing protein